MGKRFLLLIVLVMGIWMAAAPSAEAGWRWGYRGGYARYRSYGGYYRGGVVGYNRYTGRYGAARAYYDPYTGRYAYRYAYRY
jgi:hypothetical protein